MRSRLALVVFGWLGAAALLHCSSSNNAGTSGSGSGSGSSSSGGTTSSSSGTGSGSQGSTTSPDAGSDADVADAGPPRTPCTTSAQCGTSATAACCSGYCTDTAHDPQNCGSCGNACTTSQFCTGTACDQANLANVCANPRVTVVFDSVASDDDAGWTVGQTLATVCSPAPSLRGVLQDAGGVLDPTTGAPVALPGDTIVAGGGGYYQNVVQYMDNAGATAVTLGGDGTNGWFEERATGTDLVKVPVASLTASHDYFLVELSVDPASGALGVFAIGMLGPGTMAASVYAQGELIPNRAKYTDSWYLYEWTGSSDAGVATMSDSFTLLAHGQ